MLNGYLIQREQEKIRSFEAAPATGLEIVAKRQSRLVRNYRKRVEKFVREMAQKPVIMTSHPGEVSASPVKLAQTRNLSTAVFKGRRKTLGEQFEERQFYGRPRFIVNTWKSEQDRIDEAVKRNLYLMTDPISKAASEHQFRNRDPQREIQPKMCFSKGSLRYNPPSTSQHSRRSLSTGKLSSFKDHPGLSNNSKLYFKAAVDLYMQNGCLRSDLFPSYPEGVEIYEPYPVIKRKDKSNTTPKEPDYSEYDATESKIDESLFINPFILKKRKSELDSWKKARAIENLRGLSQASSPVNTKTSIKPTNVRFLDSRKGEDDEQQDILKVAKKVLIACNVERQKSTKNMKRLKRGEGLLVSAASSRCSSINESNNK